jgi:transposase-like protein
MFLGRSIQLWGQRKNIQRYRYKDCWGFFNDLTGTPLAYDKKLDKWTAIAHAYKKVYRFAKPISG